MAGATAETLQFAPSTVADGGYYHCVATSPWGSASSQTAPLLVFDPRLVNRADFVGHTIPARMAAGESLNVGVTMKNTSSLSWSGAQGYALGVVADPGGFFKGAARLPFPEGLVAIPLVGDSQFIGQIEAPAAPGVYSIDFRMVEELVEFFGQTGRVTVEVVPPPNEAAEWERYE